LTYVSLPVQKVEELLIGQSCLPNDALDNVLRQVKPFMVWNRDPARLAWVLHVNVRTCLLVNIEAALLKRADDLSRLVVGKLGRLSA
jgi:hypothetical protein